MEERKSNVRAIPEAFGTRQTGPLRESVPAVPRQSRAATVESPRRRATAAARRTKATVTGEERRRLIAQAAYFRAERRGFAPGSELEDWLAAEADIDRMYPKSGIKHPA